MHQRIITVLAVIFGLGTAIFGALYFQGKSGLPLLPVPTTSAPADRSTEATDAAADSLIYPYYGGAPQYVYSYALNTTFPSRGETMPVYKIAPRAYDRAAAVALAAAFGFSDPPIELEGTFIFTRGTTPTSYQRESEGESGGAGDTDSSQTTPSEPSKPTTVEPPAEPNYDGQELSVSAEGYVYYTDYPVSQGGVAITTEDTAAQNQPPAGVPTTDAAIDAAVAYLRSVGLLPAMYETAAGDPYGVYSVTVTPLQDGNPIQAGAITILVGDEAAIASVSLRAVSTNPFQPYPIKTQAEMLNLKTLEYRIDRVTISYVSAYAEDGAEYAQPVYVLTGADSLGNAFQFEIPAVKAEFLQNPQILPLYERGAEGAP